MHSTIRATILYATPIAGLLAPEPWATIILTTWAATQAVLEARDHHRFTATVWAGLALVALMFSVDALTLAAVYLGILCGALLIGNVGYQLGRDDERAEVLRAIAVSESAAEVHQAMRRARNVAKGRYFRG